MEKIKSRPGLLNHFQKSPQEIQWYFAHLPGLITDYPLDVAIAYVFAQVEQAHIMALYCGVVKIHRVDKDVARKLISTHHMTRKEFRSKYQIVYNKIIPDSTSHLILVAEAVRDNVMHGKSTSDDDKRNAIAHALAYASNLNDLTVELGGPQPFGDLRGFKGAGQPLAKETSRWVLKGMGFGKEG